MRYHVRIDDDSYEVSVSPQTANTYEVLSLRTNQPASKQPQSTTAENVPASVTFAGDTVCVILDGKVYDLAISGKAPHYKATFRGRQYQTTVASSHQALATQASPPPPITGTVYSPIPGRVVEILVEEGQTVDAGAPLLVLEAMKMQNEIFSPHAGTVSRILVQINQTVESASLLVEVQPEKRD